MAEGREAVDIADNLRAVAPEPMNRTEDRIPVGDNFAPDILEEVDLD